MAILDGELTARGESLGARLGAVRGSVPSGVSVGIMDSIPESDAVAGYLDQGYLRIKLKIGPGWDVGAGGGGPRTVRRTLLLQVDANTACTLADDGRLAELDPFELVLIDQPLPEDDVAGHAVANRIKTPVCLDESITSASAAVDAIDRGACSVVDVEAGPGRGYLEAVRVHDAGSARGVPVWCGGMLETGLGRAANVALAALPGFALPGTLRLRTGTGTATSPSLSCSRRAVLAGAVRGRSRGPARPGGAEGGHDVGRGGALGRRPGLREGSKQRQRPGLAVRFGGSGRLAGWPPWPPWPAGRPARFGRPGRFSGSGRLAALAAWPPRRPACLVVSPPA